MDNPYVFRGPVRDPAMFFGRAHELNEIAAFLRANQSVSIVGPRKIGKTSLLFHLMRPETWSGVGLGKETLLVYLDCEVLGESSGAEILGQFAGEIAGTLDARGLPAEPSLEKALDRPSRLSFEAAIRRLNQRGLRVVLILDEFERLSVNANLDVNFFNALRSAAGRYQFAFITASARPLIHLTYSGQSQEILSSPFFNIFASLFLGLLPEDEAHQLIREPAQRAGAPFPSELEDFIYDLAGGHPLALQIACFHAYATPDNTPAGLAEIERRTMLELTPHFEYYWHNLTPDEQNTLRQLSEAASRAPHDTTLRGILRDLAQKCMLIAHEGNYRHSSRACALFVASQGAAPPDVSRTGRSLTGTRLGSYEVLELLGRGGMAEVYKGRHPRLDRTVAIKIMPPRLAADADFRQRFEREARAIAALRHPNIVQVFDFGDAEETYYMVMEYIEGTDLARYMRENGPLPLEQVRPIVRDIASALDYAHAQGLVHRDVKPSNVMLENVGRIGNSPYMRVVLTDFGIAKILTSDTGATQSGMIMGTLDYIAPEQVRVSAQVDSRADVYALGVMLYQMLTGELPFRGEHAGAVMLAHLQQPAPDPRGVRPELPQSVANAIMRAMAKKADDRFSTAGELAEAIGA